MVRRMLSHQKVRKIQGTIYTHKIVQKPSVELWTSQILNKHYTNDVVEVECQQMLTLKGS